MKGNIKVIVAAVVAVAAGLGGFFYWQQRSVSAQSTPTTPAVAVDPKKYKDGTYSADGTYGTPGGVEGLSVSVTLSGGVVTDAQVVSKANNDVSKNYQNRFSTGYKATVVGKYIDTVSLRSVSGSSLTPKGFMDALANIKVQAKS